MIMASTSTSTVFSGTKYDVFLSFRGQDTRPTFTSHLFAALGRKSIRTFRDDTLLRGVEISSFLLEAIRVSKISVVVFSEHYASSRWCLEELAYIMECRENMGQIVLPIFYNVDPSDVRDQSGAFGAAFGIVEEKFRDKFDLVQKWRTVLHKAGDLDGWTSSNYSDDSDLIEQVADQIEEICPINYTAAPAGLISIDWQIEKILSLLRVDQATDGCYSVGVWGVGGIGKTTTAKQIFSKISNEFDLHYFFGDVREKFEKLGEVGVLKEFYSQLGFETKDIQTVDVVPSFIGHMLCKTKVLIVLDDLNNPKQLKTLLTNVPYGRESRIIVTSRDEKVLENGVHEIHKMEGLNDNSALQLLNNKAFKEMHPPKDYEKLSYEAVRYAGGVPLALEVLGSHLCNKTPEEWADFLKELEQFHDSGIQEILRKSYNELDQNEKDIFLDIACFFKGDLIDRVKGIVDGCGLPSSGIRRLTDKCLISIVDNRIMMHDLIQEMGQDFARQEGSRLWKSEDICDMFKTNTGNKEVQGICAPDSFDRNVDLHPAAFSNMHNLRILIFPHSWRHKTLYTLKGDQSENLEYLSNKLSVLHWDNYPCKSLPSSLFMDNLVELSMSNSNITQLGDGEKLPLNLKKLNLSDCRHLKKIPNLSCATNLEEISLSNCISLVEIHLSIGLDKLVKLYLDGCESLMMLPEIPKGIRILILQNSGVRDWLPESQILDNLYLLKMSNCRIKSLPSLNFKCPDELYRKLDLSYCLNLRKLSEMGGNVQGINLKGSAIEELSLSIGSLSSLVELLMSDCKHLEIIPKTICKLGCLEILDLSGCSKLGELPPLDGLTSLRELLLDGTALQEIPNGIVSLSSLCSLSLRNCKRLQDLPELPQQLQQLDVQNCTSLRTVKSSFFLPRYDEYWVDDYKYNYCNCWNLDENNRSNILEKAEDTIKSSSLDIMVCVPGSKIPDWYEYQGEGFSFSVQFLPNYFDTGFLDFDLSVVLELNSCFYSSIYIECTCIFKNVNNLLSKRYTCQMNIEGNVESDHVFLWTDGHQIKSNIFLKDNNCDVIEASFEFKAHKKFNEETCEVKIKKCGVHKRDDSEYDDDDDDSNRKRCRENKEDEALPNKRMKEMDAGLLSSTSSFKRIYDVDLSSEGASSSGDEKSKGLEEIKEKSTQAESPSSPSYFPEVPKTWAKEYIFYIEHGESERQWYIGDYSMKGCREFCKVPSTIPIHGSPVIIANFIYYCGGCYASSSFYSSRVYMFDILNPDKGWVDGACMNANRLSPAVVSVDGKIYVFGGHSYSKYPVAEVFDPNSKCWEPLVSDIPLHPDLVYENNFTLLGVCDREILLHICDRIFTYNIDTECWSLKRKDFSLNDIIINTVRGDVVFFWKRKGPYIRYSLWNDDLSTRTAYHLSDCLLSSDLYDVLLLHASFELHDEDIKLALEKLKRDTFFLNPLEYVLHQSEGSLTHIFSLDRPLHLRIVDWIEYYFSDEYLKKSPSLRQEMDVDQGWVSIDFISKYINVQFGSDRIKVISDAIKNSSIVEVQGDKLRRRNDWERWVMPPDHSKSSTSHGSGKSRADDLD